MGDDLCKEYVHLVKADKFFMAASKAGFMPLQKLQNLAATRLKELEESYKKLTGMGVKDLSE